MVLRIEVTRAGDLGNLTDFLYDPDFKDSTEKPETENTEGTSSKDILILYKEPKHGILS